MIVYKAYKKNQWWAAKTRYPPYNSLVGNKNPLPTRQFIGGQQKPVTHPTLNLIYNITVCRRLITNDK
ncbi:MAG: hypothetical protein DRR16_33845 [Candidatus Parabeggiatoa sp. nov. 3]|nr:MAG: hypothetical protein DRR00_34400 [Gammaproteobacteria bacterium]RKZ50388.1 MAG: hypothetical protein DRQ99_33905 [Gammaproteobacteria bacterium]RKZ72701.1 MAG: hypothetical protein DRR16_33845 [Gammaproteobacteria bacterium]